MKNIFKVARISFVFLVTDTIITLIIALFYGAFQEYYFKKFYGIKSYAEGALFSGIIRFIYCFAISIVLFFLFNRFLKLNNNLIKLTLINVMSYILISLVYGILLKNGFKIVFIDWNPIYYMILFSTIFSPLILNRIPYFKKLMIDL